MVEEDREREASEVHVVHNWCYLGTAQSESEIAEVLGIGESNAGTRLHRTVTKLREACHGAL